MKRALVTFLVVLALTQEGFAPWAAHRVISARSIPSESKTVPPSEFDEVTALLDRAVSVSGAGESKLRIGVAVKGDQLEPNKGYYLVIGKTRFAADALDFRHSVQFWGKKSFAEKEHATIQDIRPLQVSKKGGTNLVEIVLERKEAMRSYIVWDFKIIFESDGWVRINDGGLWLTYDLPAFVEAYDRSQPAKSK